MTTYSEQLEQLAAQLKRARAALSEDLAEAVSRKDWGALLRDKADVVALVEIVDEKLQEADFLSLVHAAADQERARTRPRGRPRRARRRSGEGPRGMKPETRAGSAAAPA